MHAARRVAVAVVVAAVMGLTGAPAALAATQPASGQLIEGTPTYLSDTTVGGYEILTHHGRPGSN